MCIAMSKPIDERISETNMLMSINGVPYSLNILSWLFTSFISSIFYTVPIIVILHFFATENALAVPMFYYGNPIIYWLIMTLHILHIIAFGLHCISSFPTAPLMALPYLCLHLMAFVAEFFAKMFCFPMIILSGILIPHMLTHRTFAVINYYENINVGLQWNNLFQNVDLADGNQGNMGVMLIFSLIGIIAHYILCIYVYHDSPGKCGVGKGHFNFLQRFRRSNKDEKIENLKSENNVKESSELSKGTDTSIIKIRNLKKYYKYNDHYNDWEIPWRGGISVDCFQGQITALLGEKRFTVMAILTGLFSPIEGSVLIDGKNINDSLYEIKDFGSCSRKNWLFPSLSVTQHLQFFGTLKNRSKSKFTIQEDIETLLHKLKLIEKRNALPHELSDSQKRLLCVAIALIGDSSILILDEPTAGLDSASKRDIWNILWEMRGEKTILISTQDMKDADIHSLRTVILHDNNSKVHDSSLFLKKLLENGIIEERDQQEILSCTYPQTCKPVSDSLDETMNLEQGPSKVVQDHKTDEPKKILKCEKIIYIKKILAKFFDAQFYSFLVTFSSLLLVLNAMLSALIPDDNTSKPVTMRLDTYSEPYYSFQYDNVSELYGINYKIYAEKFKGKRIDDFKEDRNLTAALLKSGERYPLENENKPVVAAKFIRDANAVCATAFYDADKSQYAESISVNLLTNALIKTLIGTDHSITISIKLPYGEVRTLLYDIINEITIFRYYAVGFIASFCVCTITAYFVTHRMFKIRSDLKRLHEMTKLSHWTVFAFDFIGYLTLMLILLFCFIVLHYLSFRIFGIIDVLIMIALIALSGINIIPIVHSFYFFKPPIKNFKILVFLLLAFVSMETIKIILVEFDIIDLSNIFYRVQKELFSVIPYISFFNAQIAFFKITSTNFDCERISNYFKAEDLCKYNTTCCAMNCNNGTCENYLKYYDGFSDNMSLEGNILRLCILPIFYFILLNILEYKKIKNIHTLEDGVTRIHNNIASKISRIKSSCHHLLNTAEKHKDRTESFSTRCKI